MPTVAIRINGAAAGPNLDLPINTLVTLTNNDNTGVTTWNWSFITRPEGSAAAIASASSATSTFTPDVEGTYLIQLVVNQALVTQASGRTVAAVLFVKTRQRAPAGREATEADATLGWSLANNRVLKQVTDVAADPMQVVAVISGESGHAVWTKGDVAAANGTSLIKTGLPGQERLMRVDLVFSDPASEWEHRPLFVFERAVSGAGTAAPGQLAVFRHVGLIQDVSDAPNTPVVDDIVYLDDNGRLSTVAGGITRILGRVVGVPTATSFHAVIDGSKAALT